MAITFNRTDGIHSRVAKLTLEQVEEIRAEYVSGKRGSTEAKRYKISAVHYNRIGRKVAWKPTEAS